jgi:DeoR/GlpR family transcriptional regulator of sugar metabolism
MPVVTRKDLIAHRQVSERTIKRILPRLELAGLSYRILPGKGSPHGYDPAEVNAALDLFEETHPAMRNSKVWRASHRSWNQP